MEWVNDLGAVRLPGSSERSQPVFSNRWQVGDGDPGGAALLSLNRLAIVLLLVFAERTLPSPQVRRWESGEAAAPGTIWELLVGVP